MSPRPATTSAGEALLTRYRIFKTDDGGLTLKYQGYRDAKSSEAALREFLHADTVGHYSAVNENGIKLRSLKPRSGPVIETEPLPWPETPAPATTVAPAAAESETA